ncbi:ATP-binding protein [Phosphitispora sp. TUW77]|uniref:ATP-binding protein n=1 Tax=Phosphitispora sp. TUW77 TaxID=3152361 RepID=UPI003AB69019
MILNSILIIMFNLNNNTTFILLAILLGGVIISCGSIFRHLYSTKKRIRMMTEKLNEVAAGNFTTAILDKGTDELANLAGSINNLVRKICEYHEDDKRMLADDFMYEKFAAVGEIAAGTAHEIRNPLTSIKGFTYLLQDKFEQGEQGWEYAQIIKQEVQHIEDIINQFLIMAAPSFLVMEQSSLNELINQLLPDIAMDAVSNGVLIETNLFGRIPDVYVDRKQVVQLVGNLCKNSIQAMSDGGILKIETKYLGEDNMATLIINDTGIGISPEVLNRIGDPFFTTREEAAGLGLTVCYRIVQNHGGSMKVNSIKGCGTTCVVKLPVT